MVKLVLLHIRKQGSKGHLNPLKRMYCLKRINKDYLRKCMFLKI